MNGSCLIEAGTVLAGLDRHGKMALRHDAAIRVDNGMIVQIGAWEAVADGNGHLPRYGSRGCIAMPGLVNAHHHSGATPLMLGVPYGPLELWLPKLRAMRKVPAKLDALYSAIEMLESGVTTVQHIRGELSGAPELWRTEAQACLSAYDEIGMRAGFCFMISDRNRIGYDRDADLVAALPAKARDWLAPQLAAEAIPIAEQLAFYGELRRSLPAERRGHVRFNLAPANLNWCSDDALQAIFETARADGAEIHMHLAETERQAEFARRQYGRSAIQHLNALGCLGANVTFGHGIWLSGEDLDLIAECGCSICHNASSGLRLSSGVAPVVAMRERGIRVALGMDQATIADDRDMLLEMKVVSALHRGTGLDDSEPDAAAILQMGSEHGAKTIGFGGRIGRLEPGYQADIVLLDRTALERPFVNPRTPISETILHRAGRHAIKQVFVGGRLVVDDGKVVTVDREAVLAELGEHLKQPETAQETAAWEAMAEMLPVLQARLEAAGYGESARAYRWNALGDYSHFRLE